VTSLRPSVHFFFPPSNSSGFFQGVLPAAGCIVGVDFSRRPKPTPPPIPSFHALGLPASGPSPLGPDNGGWFHKACIPIFSFAVIPARCRLLTPPSSISRFPHGQSHSSFLAGGVFPFFSRDPPRHCPPPFFATFDVGISPCIIGPPFFPRRKIFFFPMVCPSFSYSSWSIHFQARVFWELFPFSPPRTPHPPFTYPGRFPNDVVFLLRSEISFVCPVGPQRSFTRLIWGLPCFFPFGAFSLGRPFFVLYNCFFLHGQTPPPYPRRNLCIMLLPP